MKKVLSRKPMISIDEQIELLKSKGIKFNIMSEVEAKKYLSNNNNYFKVTSYRKNYDKHPGGVQVGQYIHLEFAYLVDLAIIDMRIRYHILHMALDIEHYIRMD
ncbi:Abi family protein [Lachnobacterium bovis]|uniref:Abi family protein n=1 Tax=Lachnobacterium bovis TaxID=140626 RepID=UPI00048995ED|nr:Abi family protein [Lachnobacterium bovis]